MSEQNVDTTASVANKSESVEPTVPVALESIRNVRDIIEGAEGYIFDALRELSFDVAQSNAHSGTVRSLLMAVSALEAITKAELRDAIVVADPGAMEGGAS